MSDVKTYCFPEGGAFGGSSTEGILLGSMMNGGGGFGGGMNSPIWALIILGLLRQWGYDGGGNNAQLSQIQDTLNTNNGNQLLMNAITTQGAANVTATKELAAATNCNYNAMQCAINSIQQQIANKAAQDGTNFMQIVNAVNNGDSMIANTLQSCCCDVKNLVTNLNYEGRLADQAQTAFIGGKIDAQTTLINDKFCQLELRGVQDKLDQERAKNLALTNQLSQEHQNATFAAMLAPLKSDVDAIKCKLPQTYNVPYQPFTAIPNCVAYQAFGLNPYANGGVFG